MKHKTNFKGNTDYNIREDEFQLIVAERRKGRKKKCYFKGTFGIKRITLT